MVSEAILNERLPGGVAVVTLNRPDRLNALNHELHGGLDAALTELEDDPEVRAIVVTGAGERAFSAGQDVHEQASYDDDEMLLGYLRREPWNWHIASCSKPTVGAIRGHAFGAGSVVATGLDVRIGSPNTTFRATAVAYGGVNLSWSLPTIVGTGRAKEWILTSRIIEAPELHAAGWLNAVVDDDEVLEVAIDTATQIASHRAEASQAAKRLINESVGRTMRDAQRAETVLAVTDLRPGQVGTLFADFLSRG